MVGEFTAEDETEAGNRTGDPTGDPTSDPTGDPTSDPTGDPTGDPTSDPTSADSAPPAAKIPTIQIEISDAARATLEADPFHADDVNGVFVDGTGTRYEGVDISFRGAFALQNLINQGDRRNWKVKFRGAQKYRGRREWNFNYEPNLRQKLAYDLMNLAGVKLTTARHVLCVVNGVPQGLYLEYEDPDDLDWLLESFSDGTGDIYKAAYDLPDATDQRAFAELTYLGENDSDYLLHYNKKTNKDGDLETDYSSIREFIFGLNSTAAADVPAWLDENVDVDGLLSYLVVANFISHWDGYPHRPKNFWMYENPASGIWSLIPWDMDGTFQTNAFGLNQMGTTASVFYQFDGYEPYEHQDDEGTERPLVRRMMEHARFREAYVARYEEALTTFLRQEALLEHLAELFALAQQYATSEDLNQLEWTRAEMERFIQQRWIHVDQELSN